MERNLALIALFAALIAALGLIPKFTLGFGVPITAQSLGGYAMRYRLRVQARCLGRTLILVLVALGLPLLAGGRGGLGVFVSPSAGFLIGFPIAAFVTGFIVRKMARCTARASVRAWFSRWWRYCTLCFRRCWARDWF